MMHVFFSFYCCFSNATNRLLRNKIFLIFTLFSVFAGHSWAQVSSSKDRFEVNAIKGCAPLQVTAVNTSGLDPSQFPIVWNMDWDGNQNNITVDPGQSAAQADTTYAIPGTYQILQVIGNQSDPIDTLTIEVLPDNPPNFSVSNCINNTIYVDFSQDTVFDDLVIDFGDGNGATVPVSDGNLIHQYSSGGEYTVSVQGTFQNGGLSCSTYDTTITTVNNLSVARINILRVESDQEIEVAYNLADPSVSYRLEVAENSSADADFSFASVGLNSLSSVYTFSDSQLDTRNNYYCFRIVAVNRCDESLNQFSNIVCSIDLQGTAENQQNRLDWNTEGFTNFSIGRDGESLSTTTVSNFTDTTVVCQEEYSYTITATSAEGATSVSNSELITAISVSVPPAPQNLVVRLTGTSARLNWAGVSNAALYYIYRSEAGGSMVLYDSLQASGSQRYNFTDPAALEFDVSYCYQVSYRDECANESVLSEEACVTLPSQARVFFPTAFSPDGDGLNDIFVYKANLLASVNFTIFNRWGELIFATQELGEGWDGTYGKTLAPQGTYLYKLEVEDEQGNSFVRTGKVILLQTSR